MQIGTVVVRKVEIKSLFQQPLSINSLKEKLPMKFALDFTVDQVNESLVFSARGLTAMVEDGKNFIECRASSEEEINPAKKFVTGLSKMIGKYAKIKALDELQLANCELELILPYNYSRLLDNKSLVDLRFSRKGETVHLSSLRFDVDSSLSFSIGELKATDAIPFLRQRVFERSLEKYMPQGIVTALKNRIYSILNHEFNMILKKHHIQQLYKLRARGDNFEDAHSILSKIAESLPKRKRVIMQRRVGISINRLSESIFPILRRAAKDVGIPESAVRRLLMEIRREQDLLRHARARAREYSLSDFG